MKFMSVVSVGLISGLLGISSFGASASAQQNPWTGFYVGIHGGYTSADVDVVESRADLIKANYDPRNALPAVGVERSRWTGGVGAGYGWSFGQFVVGVEADYTWLNLGGSTNVITVVPGFVNTANFAASTMDWLATARAKLGYVVMPNLMVYGTGGFAFGEVAHSRATGTGGFGTVPQGGASGRETGWALGAGAEYAISKSVGLKFEYIHFDLGTTKFTVTDGFSTVNASAKNEGDILRVGIDYRF